jgi:NAD(P)H-nitrite reductase large subunit
MKVVIIGSGPAGIVAAEGLRKGDPTVELTMVTQEPYPPYSPPAMADHFLYDREEPLFWRGKDICTKLGMAYRTESHVVGLDAAARQIVLRGDDRISYDHLLIASGSRLHAPVEGAELGGVHDFKSLVAAEAIVGRVRRGEATTAVIVGAGFIGMEIALLLADLGVRVTIIGRREWVMPRMLDRETAAIAGRAMEERGVALRLGVEATGFVERDRRAGGVRMSDGEVVTADLYIAATGVKPNVGFLAGSGVEHKWGISVDRRMQTSVPGIWAAGDVVEAPDRVTGEAYVHAIFPNAVDQARVVAANILGASEEYVGAESMNSLKHLGLPIMAVGAMSGAEEIVWRDSGVLRKVFIDDGRVVGFRFSGDVSGGGFLRSMMWRRDDVRRHGRRLARPGFGVADLVLPAMST